MSSQTISPLPLFLAALGGGAVAALGATLLASDEPATQAAGGAALDPGGDAALRQELAELRDQVARLQQDQALGAPMAERRSAPGADEELVRRLVAEALAQAGGPALAAGAPDSLEALGVDELYARLNDPDLSFTETQELWQAAREAGRLEELVGWLKERAEANPSDPELQVELGQALIQRIQEVGNSPLAGEYAMAADGAFDRALELDPTHWDARFNKAVSLSFWPPVLGKQPAAIAQFETLVAQQAGVAPAPGHAQTHLLLGNLYQQTGQVDKAVAAWSQGLQIFPDDAALAQQLALAKQAASDQ